MGPELVQQGAELRTLGGVKELGHIADVARPLAGFEELLEDEPHPVRIVAGSRQRCPWPSRVSAFMRPVPYLAVVAK